MVGAAKQRYQRSRRRVRTKLGRGIGTDSTIHAEMWLVNLSLGHVAPEPEISFRFLRQSRLHERHSTSKVQRIPCLWISHLLWVCPDYDGLSRPEPAPYGRSGAIPP